MTVIMATQPALRNIDYVPTVFDFGPQTLTDEQFESLARNHPDLNIELSAEGELIIVAPTLPYTGGQNADLIFLLLGREATRPERSSIRIHSLRFLMVPSGRRTRPGF